MYESVKYILDLANYLSLIICASCIFSCSMFAFKRLTADEEDIIRKANKNIKYCLIGSGTALCIYGLITTIIKTVK